MNDLQITNMVMADAANRKINYTATYSDGTHIEGFVTMAEGEYEALSFADLKAKVQSLIITNLGGTVSKGSPSIDSVDTTDDSATIEAE